MLNSRVKENMKGHPGYQGDHTDYCVEILKQVGSPRLKLLFDVYHVQIMDGDIIARIRKYADWIAHVHTAGNPGRCELDAKQEINYAPVMKALTEVGYTGYTGHEFIPTRDPLAGLTEAIKTCDC
jgi:hydroxypyruvate isomerase